MDVPNNGGKLFFKNIFSKKISGYLKVCTDESGQAAQILPTSSEESEDSETEISKNEFRNILSPHIARIKPNGQVSFFL